MRRSVLAALAVAAGLWPEAARAADDTQTLEHLCQVICGDWISDDYDPDRKWTKLKLEWDAAQGAIVGTQIGFAGIPAKPGRVAIEVRRDPATGRLAYTMRSDGAAAITFEVTAQTAGGATLTGFVPGEPETGAVIDFERMGPNHLGERRREIGEGYEQVSGVTTYLKVGSGPH